MKPIALLLFVTLPTAAQTATSAKPAARPVRRATTSASCVKLPEISSKVPALPAGLPCAKPLYTITSVPSAKLDYVSPLEGPNFAETLGIVPSSFSLAYIDTKVGTGELASPHPWYSMLYTGYLVDGTKFDSSTDLSAPFNVPIGTHRVIPGWDTGFAGMRVGGKRRLFVPYQLAYGAQGRGAIPAKAELIFDVELLAVSDTEPKSAKAPVPPAGAPVRPAPGTPASPTGTPLPPSATIPPAPPGSSQNVVGKPTAGAPVSPSTDPTSPTSAPPTSTSPPATLKTPPQTTPKR